MKRINGAQYLVVAINLPLHWSATGLPIGTQFVGCFGEEATCSASRRSLNGRGLRRIARSRIGLSLALSLSLRGRGLR